MRICTIDLSLKSLLGLVAIECEVGLRPVQYFSLLAFILNSPITYDGIIGTNIKHLKVSPDFPTFASGCPTRRVFTRKPTMWPFSVNSKLCGVTRRCLIIGIASVLLPVIVIASLVGVYYPKGEFK